MTCMPYACYVQLKDQPSLKMLPTMSVHSATGHNLCLVGLMCCEATTVKLEFKYTFIMCRKSQRDLIIGLDMQQLYCLGSDWTDNGWMFIHQDTDISVVP